MKESFLNEGSVEEVSGPTMASIINFIYNSCIILTHDNVYDVLEAAEYLRIPSKYCYCSYFYDIQCHSKGKNFTKVNISCTSLVKFVVNCILTVKLFCAKIPDNFGGKCLVCINVAMA